MIHMGLIPEFQILIHGSEQKQGFGAEGHRIKRDKRGYFTAEIATVDKNIAKLNIALGVKS